MDALAGVLAKDPNAKARPRRYPSIEIFPKLKCSLIEGILVLIAELLKPPYERGIGSELRHMTDRR